MVRTKEQSIRFNTIISKLGIDKEGKEDLVYNITQGRATSSKDLTHLECDKLIKNLQPNVLIEGDKQRKKILSIVHELGWETPTGKIDWNALNPYLLKYGYLHKLFNDYTPNELPKLVTQFENMLKDSYAKG
jgi:hypothetical protein